MTSTKRTWFKSLLATAAMATVAVGLLGAAPAARADNDHHWNGNNNWHGNYSYGYRPYYYSTPYYNYYAPPPAYYYPPPAYYGPPSVGFSFRF